MRNGELNAAVKLNSMREVDVIDIAQVMLARRVESYLSASGMSVHDFGLEIGERGREIVKGLREGRHIGVLIEAKIKAFLSRQGCPRQSEELRIPAIEDMAARNARINAAIVAEAGHRRVAVRDLLADLVTRGWLSYADERGIEF